MSKKELSTAVSTAASKFFSSHLEASETNNYNNSKDTNVNNVTNKSKHYDERGKRDVRHGLLLDKQLKKDLTLLCYATGNRSINDYIVSLLIEHTEQPKNKRLLENYNKLKSE